MSTCNDPMNLLVQCTGTIKDGLCNKCYHRSTNTGTQCTELYEIIPPISPKVSPELQKHLDNLEALKDYMLKNC